VRPGRVADHSPPSSAAVMEEYSYTSTHPLDHTGPVTGSLYFTLYNIFRWASYQIFRLLFALQGIRRVTVTGKTVSVLAIRESVVSHRRVLL